MVNAKTAGESSTLERIQQALIDGHKLRDIKDVIESSGENHLKRLTTEVDKRIVDLAEGKYSKDVVKKELAEWLLEFASEDKLWEYFDEILQMENTKGSWLISKIPANKLSERQILAIPKRWTWESPPHVYISKTLVNTFLAAVKEWSPNKLSTVLFPLITCQRVYEDNDAVANRAKDLINKIPIELIIPMLDKLLGHFKREQLTAQATIAKLILRVLAVEKTPAEMTEYMEFLFEVYAITGAPGNENVKIAREFLEQIPLNKLKTKKQYLLNCFNAGIYTCDYGEQQVRKLIAKLLLKVFHGYSSSELADNFSALINCWKVVGNEGWGNDGAINLIERIKRGDLQPIEKEILEVPAGLPLLREDLLNKCGYYKNLRASIFSEVNNR